jgi:Carboxypeptidase regulatory-like domain
VAPGPERGLALSLLLAASVAGASPARAQDWGDIAGTAVDAAGAAVPGVAVTLASPALLQPRTTTSATNGAYRFARVGVGTYSVRFEAAGFTPVVCEGVGVETGIHVTVNATLGAATGAEVARLTAGPPGPDALNPARGARYPREALDLLPTSRDARALLALTPGVAIDRAEAAGGRLAGLVSRGGTATSAVWTLNGVEILALDAGDGSPPIIDFDALEQVHISTARAGPARAAGGIGVSMVTRSVTDRFRGSVRFTGTDERLQADNLDAALRAQGAGAGNPIQNAVDYGVEAGGPLRRGRAWIWGSFGRQVTRTGIVNFYRDTPECAGLSGATAASVPLDRLRACRQTDETAAWTTSLETTVRLGPENTLTWFTQFAERVRPSSGASARRPVETTYRVHGAPSAYGTPLWTTGPASVWRASDRHVFGGRWLAEAQWAHVGHSSASDFQTESLAAVQPRYEMTTASWSRSYRRTVSVRPADSVDVSADLFRPSWLGGAHAIEAGWRWRTLGLYDASHVGGNAVARVRAGVPVEATLWRDAETAYRLGTQAAWVQDTYTRRRLTLTLGLRWDRRHERALGSRVPAHPFQGQVTSSGALFDLLPAVDFGGADPGRAQHEVSPRIGAAYDLTGSGRTILDVSIGRAYRQEASVRWAQALNPVTAASVRLPWRDANGDGVVQASELDATRLLAFSGNYDPGQAGLPGPATLVDPDVRRETTDELVVALDHQLGRALGVGLGYTWRRDANLPFEYAIGISSADYASRVYTPPASDCPEGARCEAVVYWEPTVPIPTRRLVTNRLDTDRRYHGLEVSVRRRMSGGWMLSGNVSLNDVREYYRSPRAYQDPTNIDQLNAAQWSASANATTNARWLVKLAGAYSLPRWRLGLSGVYQAREGHAFAAAIQTPSRANAAGTATVLLDRMGEIRLPAVQSLDVGATIPVRVAGVRLTASVDVFNLMNANTVLRRQRIQNSATANQATLILAPRLVRFGVKATW